MLVSFVKSHIRPYMDEIVTLMRVSGNECFGLFVSVWVKGYSEAGLDNLDIFSWVVVELLQPEYKKVEQGVPLG